MFRLPAVLFLLFAAATAHGNTPVPRDARLHVVSAKGGDAVVLQLDLDGRTARVSLSPDTALEASAARAVPAIASGRQRLFAGRIEDAAGSWARLSRLDDRWDGVLFDGDGYWTLLPASDAPGARKAGLARGSHALLRGDEAWAALDLHGDMLAPPPGAAPAADGTLAAKRGSTYNLGLSLVLDTEFQSRWPNPASRAASMLNIVDGYYSRTTNTSVYLEDLRLLPAGNAGMTATDTGDLLDQFTAYARSPQAPDFHAAVHLLTGKNAIGGGLAYVGTLCNPDYATGVSAAKYDVGTSAAVLAHELGHNYGADHDGSGNAAACPNGQYVMETTITVGAPEEDFSSCSIAVFAQRAATGFLCLRDPAPGTLFEDGFEG